MVVLEEDENIKNEWFNMSYELQISNVGSEVLRADRWKNRGNEKRMRTFYNVAVSFLRIMLKDPKNEVRRDELKMRIDELTDYFLGDNRRGTTSETLEKYYNAFL